MYRSHWMQRQDHPIGIHHAWIYLHVHQLYHHEMIWMGHWKERVWAQIEQEQQQVEQQLWLVSSLPSWIEQRHLHSKERMDYQ